MKKKINIFMMICLTVVLLSGCGNQDSTEKGTTSKEDIIIVGTTGGTPGYSVLNDKGELEGFEIDMWEEIGKRISYDVKYEQMQFASLFPLLDDGRIDTVANAVVPTPEREELYNFSDSYFYDEQVLMATADKNVSDLKELDGWSVGIMPGTTGSDDIDYVENKANIKLDRIDIESEVIDEVILGKIDLGIRSESMAIDLINKRGEDELKVLIGMGFYMEDGYPFTKDEKGDKLRELTNGAISEMREDGTLSDISKRWFGTDFTAIPEQ